MKRTLLLSFIIISNLVAMAATIEISITTFGEIQGRVYDDLKNPIADANIAVIKNDNLIAGASTDHNGFYSVRVSPGTYMIKISAINHRTYVAEEIIIRSESIRFLDVELLFSPNILDTMTFVNPPPPVVDVGEFSPGPKFDGKWIERSGSKSIPDLIGSAAGVYQKDDGSAPSLMGSRPEHTAIYMDGVRIYGNLNIPMQAIEQVKVTLTGISAKYGDVTGGVIEISTSSY